MKATIKLHSRRYFDLINPHLTPLGLHDLTWGLSRQARFNGHTDGEPIYSVLQHTLLVMSLVPAAYRLHAALHDASEAVLGDVASPVKMLLPDYKALEARVQGAINVQYGLPAEWSPEVQAIIKRADHIALKAEARCLMYVPGPEDEGEWDWLDAYPDIGPNTLMLIPSSRPWELRQEFIEAMFEMGVRL